MTDLVKLYNPANAGSLTSEQLQGLQKLDSAQIKELATAYPNMTMQRAYLLIVDKNKTPEKQLPQLSTFENLWNLREKNAQRQWVPFNFRGQYRTKTVIPQRAKKTEVLDLSDIELMDLPGFKPFPKVGEGGVKEVVNVSANDFSSNDVQKVAVKKIKKVEAPKKTRKTKSK